MHPFEAEFVGVRHGGPYASFPQTFMSAPFCAALAWTRGAVTLAGLNDFVAVDVLAPVPRMRVIADAKCQRYQPRLEARLEDGRTLGWKETLGEAAYRLDSPKAVAMAHALGAEMTVGRELIDRLIEAVAHFEQQPNVRQLIAAAAAACRAAQGG
jgi:hypothetical protein